MKKFLSLTFVTLLATMTFANPFNRKVQNPTAYTKKMHLTQAPSSRKAAIALPAEIQHAGKQTPAIDNHQPVALPALRTAEEVLTPHVNCYKRIVDGQLVIIRNDNIYTTTGTRL